jgi:hypothetical protein
VPDLNSTPSEQASVQMARRNNRLVCEKHMLRTALERTHAALRLLQPALNVMARECLDDIIKDQIEEPLAALSRKGR